MPELPYWEGQRLPATSESQIYLYYPDAERQGEMVLVFVDTAKLDIPFGFRAKQSSAGRLFSSFGNAAQFAGGHQPVPPRPVIPDWSLSAALIAWAQTALTIPDIATEGGICKQ